VQLAFSHGVRGCQPRQRAWGRCTTVSTGGFWEQTSGDLTSGSQGQYLADNHGHPETAPATALVQFDRGVQIGLSYIKCMVNISLPVPFRLSDRPVPFDCSVEGAQFRPTNMWNRTIMFPLCGGFLALTKRSVRCPMTNVCVLLAPSAPLFRIRPNDPCTAVFASARVGEARETAA